MSEPWCVLLVEDSPSDAKLVVQALRASGHPVDFTRVDTADAMRTALGENPFDFVISDWSMPMFSAPSALQILQEMQIDLPFIIVSGTIGEDLAADVMRAGAHDYVLKDKLARLVPAVERELRECAQRAQRCAAETALRASEARFRRLADSGVVGIVVARNTGRILEANEKFLGMVGYSREDLEAGHVNWATMTPPEWSASSAPAIERLRLEGVVPPWEKEYLRKDGTRVPTLVGVAKVDEDTNMSISIDLSELKRAEAARVRAEDALRQSEEQLLHAQKMEAVGRLAGGVAHDFNNILSVIMTYGELILADLKGGDPLRADIDEICKAATRAAGLTRQLLMFSRQQVVETQVIDLNELLAGMEKMVGRILGEDVELMSMTAKPVGHIKADPSHIEQVIMNLVVNARDAMPTGGALTIETADVVLGANLGQNCLFPITPGPYVMLSVADTGCGMDKRTQARIFEPFFTTKEQGKGTGLGLSTVFGIVQRSAGNISVASEVGKGTVFRVYLPSVGEESEMPRGAVEPTTLRGAETILVVEDEEQVRTITVSILRKHGYQVVVAQHPGEALLHCERHTGAIDLLLTDVVMPQMSGPELAKRLVALRPHMRVLCMSGYTDDRVVRHGVLDHGIAFLQKPITPKSLARKVREVLDREDSVRAAQ